MWIFILNCELLLKQQPVAESVVVIIQLRCVAFILPELLALSRRNLGILFYSLSISCWAYTSLKEEGDVGLTHRKALGLLCALSLRGAAHGSGYLPVSVLMACCGLLLGPPSKQA
jgi:hypothetical protein